LYDVAEMDADADMNLVGFFLCGVVCPQLRLNLLRTLHGMNHGRKIDQEGIPDSFDDPAVVFRDQLLDEGIVDFEQSQHPGFVCAHLTAESDHVREHDRGELAGLGHWRLW
jgi:hypothetical protein